MSTLDTGLQPPTAPLLPLPAPGTRPVGRPLVAGAVAVVSWALVVAALVLLALARPPVDERMWFLLVDLTVGGVYGTVAAVTLARRSHPVPWLLAVAAVGGGLAALGATYSMLDLRHAGLPWVEQVSTLQGTAWMPGTLALFLVVPWLVRDRALGPVEWVAVTAGAALAVWLPVASYRLDPHFFDWVRLAIALGVVAALAVEVRRRRGPVEERTGLGWLALGTLVLALSFLPLVVTSVTLPIWVTPAMHLASQAVFPAAVLVVVLRNRLWGLGLVVSRTVLAGLLATGLVGLYLLVVVLLTRVLPGEGTAQLVAAASVAVAVQPARIVLARRVHRLVYGDAADPDRVVRRLGSQLVGDAPVAELLASLAEDVGRSARLESVAVLADGMEPVRWGRPTQQPQELALRHRGERVGSLEVTPRPGESLAPRDLATLADLGSVLAASVAVARAAADVDALRVRLASVRLEERRVIRREIHDGLGPSLAGIRLGLQGARNLLATDPAAATELLGHLQGEVDAAVAGVRSLSHHLLPPVLDELGLGAALTELGARHGAGDLRVEVVTDRFDQLHPLVAAAAYGIASEAVTNVVRHAGASRCRVMAQRSDGGLVLEVVDDGRGIAPDAVAGVGSRSMRERALEQGGSLHVTPAPGGGTVVRAVLPVEPTHPEERHD
ncbi:sensor histidine kinase [Nocardioides abyssi]|uniref:histidine kinase n=1 Tax=Nocardioides abyssi TaxID=3058370 RepID=A0ABT8ER91_9ACTN|nr:sensor histidine kinase [Nocardioides abyssi]MDN4160526.1 sensor histidine kinase [Nocardioides abyssi]